MAMGIRSFTWLLAPTRLSTTALRYSRRYWLTRRSGRVTCPFPSLLRRVALTLPLLGRLSLIWVLRDVEQTPISHRFLPYQTRPSTPTVTCMGLEPLEA